MKVFFEYAKYILLFVCCLNAVALFGQAPVISNFSPTNPSSSAFNIIINGSNFTDARVVKVGGIPVPFKLVSASQITAEVQAPFGNTGEITVVTGNGIANQAGYAPFFMPLFISNIYPLKGVEGTEIIIAVSMLDQFTKVTIAGVPAAVTRYSSNQLKAVVPAGASSGDIVVTSYDAAGQARSISYPGFIYLQAPVINSFTPDSGTLGTPVTIRGKYFTGVSEVVLGGDPVASFTVVSDSVINVVAGTGYSFSSFVSYCSITNEGGTTYNNSFSYIGPAAAPTISYFTPTACAGGDSIRIVGTHFTGASKVIFGSSAGPGSFFDASRFYVESDSVIIAIPGTGGSGNVYVSNNTGQVYAPGFTYITPAATIMDSLTLVDFYKSTNGNGWTNHTNWLTAQPLRTWYGITIDGFSKRVFAIGFNNNNLKGNLPNSIGNLTALADMFITGSPGLYGYLPSSLGSLTSINNLALSKCQFLGQIPASLGNLQHIDFLVLDDNKLSGAIPAALSSLTSLQTFSLRNNKLTGPIASSLGAMPINITGNQFNFDGMEAYAANNPNRYNIQSVIPISKNGDKLSVSAGGTLANNTYMWYKDRQLYATVFGDSTLTATEYGNYFVIVGNKKATEVLLYSDSIKAGYNYKKLCPPGGLLEITSDITGFYYQWQVNFGFGFINISGTNSGTYSNLLTSGSNGNEYRCLLNGGAYSKTFTVKFEDQWTGNAGTAWENAANWSCNNLPDMNTDVIISSGNVVVNSNVFCRSLTVSPAATLTVNAGFSITVTH